MGEMKTIQSCRIKRYLFNGGVICLNSKAILITFQKRNQNRTIFIPLQDWNRFKASIRNINERIAKLNSGDFTRYSERFGEVYQVGVWSAFIYIRRFFRHLTDNQLRYEKWRLYVPIKTWSSFAVAVDTMDNDNFTTMPSAVQ